MNTQISNRLKATAKIEKEKESVKPTVINDKLIKGYLIQYNKENKIFEKNDEPLWNLKHLALSYKNIIEIDNLKGLEKLQKLQLDNNIICKIQKLDHLVNLSWLDLSFNLIEDIQEKANVELEEAVRIALNEVIGAYAIVIMSKENPDLLIAAKKSSPLVIGIGEKDEFCLI